MVKSVNLLLLALIAFVMFLGINPLFSQKATSPITIKPFEEGLNDDAKLVVSALSVIAKSGTKWAMIANEMLLDLPKYSNAEIKAMYKSLLSDGMLKISNPTKNIKEIGNYCQFKFDLNELREKGSNSHAYLIGIKKNN